MLSYLRVRGLALLDDVALNFAPGMNVLTGETGAGKSIIVGALSLLRGSRGRAEIVRDGADAAIVDAQFEPKPRAVAPIQAVLGAHGLPSEDADSIVLQRVVARSGRGRSFAQGSLTTQGVLASLGDELIDICSQHEHHFLTHTPRHLEVLDAYACNGDALAEHRECYGAWREARSELQSVREKVADRDGRADYLRFQIEEIDRVAPEVGEHEELRKRLTVLRQARRWAEFVQHAHMSLYESDDAIASRLGALAEQARVGRDDSELLAQIHDQLMAAEIAAQEAATLAARFANDLDLDPTEVESAEDRLHALESLRRKHGVEVDGLVERVETMRKELEQLAGASDHLDELEARVQILHRAADKSSAVLSKRRKSAAQGLAKAIEQELAALHMPAARIDVSIELADEVGQSGKDLVEFLFSANAGESVSPLRKVASGGELSRVLLAIKGVLAAGDRVATYVFDEVDAGVGGAVAEAIGHRLKRAAAEHQVLCITHLPQIAAFADTHFRVEKQMSAGRTTTRVIELNLDQRIDELARMLGGKKVTQSARDHARALIELARAPVAKVRRAPAAVPPRGAKAGKTVSAGRTGKTQASKTTSASKSKTTASKSKATASKSKATAVSKSKATAVSKTTPASKSKSTLVAATPVSAKPRKPKSPKQTERARARSRAV